MSIIFGYISLTSKPVERETLECMKSAMDFWGPDGQGIWTGEYCGLGNLLLYNTPEALYEKLPVTDASGNLVMTAGARIDNREELFRIFDIPLGQRLVMPDSALMLKVYEKWGDACADHLIGDWAFAIWDRRRRRLFLARDHHGITALYYYKGEDFFVFSSSLKGILCLPQVPKKVNEYKIAQLLVNWNEGGPTTCYLDIMRVPPAHTLVLHDGKVTTHRYWYLEHTPEVTLKNDQEYADMFLHLYTEAVRHRLRSYRPVGATLSGGLDSGSVCILASRLLAEQGKRLPAYTAVPLYDTTGLVPPNRIGDEGPLALALAEKLGNVDVTLCRAEGIGPRCGIELALDIFNQPIYGSGNIFWIIDIFQICKSDIGSFLIGQSGNGTVSWPLANSQTTEMKSWLAATRKKLKFEMGFWKRRLLISDEFAFQTEIKKKIRLQKVSPYIFSGLQKHQLRTFILKPGENNILDQWYELGLSFGLEVRDPTIDIHLLKFLFSIPQKSSLSNNRTMYNQKFDNFFPSNILLGAFRGIQSADLIKRIQQDSEFNKIIEYLKKDKISMYVSTSKIQKSKIHTNGDGKNILTAYSIYLWINNLT